jgi:nucleoside-diphosphate-sugar epimerase
MKVLVIGGSGFLGSHLIPMLVAQNHDVTVLSRFDANLKRLRGMGARGVRGDILDPDEFVGRLSGFEAVIYMAMPVISPGRITEKIFVKLRDAVTAYYTNSIKTADRLGCPLILTSGLSFLAGGGKVFDETDPLERFGMTRINEQADRLITEIFDRGTPPLIMIMLGQLYGPGGLFLGMYHWIKRGKYRVPGTGRNMIPRVHVNDAAQGYLKALEQLPMGETFILADDTPCTVREFADYMALCMGVPKPKSVPGLFIRLVIGRYPYDTLMMNCRVRNDKAKGHLGWVPTYTSYQQGIPATIEALTKTTKRLSENARLPR